MKSIFVIGAGRSSSSLIAYLLQHAKAENWKVKVGDVSLQMAEQKIEKHECGEAIVFDMNDETQRHKEIQQADLIVSMLPASLHGKVAIDCLRYKKNLVNLCF